jgi:hypothetical protein
VDNIKISETGITIKIPDLLKTSKPGFFQPKLGLSFFREKPSLGITSAVMLYLEIIKELRTKKNKKLFISTAKSYNNA